MTRRRPAVAVAEQDGRERILSAAIRCFSELGYAGTTTAGIARAAGVTQPLVHHHFGSKDGLWRAAMDEVFANVPRIVAATGSSPHETMMETVERFVRFVADHPEVTRIIAREGAAPSPRLDYLLKRYVHAPFREVVDRLRAAQNAGIVTPDVRPELALFLILGAGSHLFDVSALAERSLGIDTTAAWTREAFVVLMRTVLEQGLFRRTT
ncbi:MAG TPA: TetR/AcrR family transcriptional regulator [Candidatus Binatia bacterium]|nr:TetR/AcrR family transcriptional regulator [Candidatus Binatia bacterium]